jgi:hypothetical protein
VVFSQKADGYVVWARIKVMVFKATCNNISVISFLSVLLVEETGENNLLQVTDKLYHIMLYQVGFKLITLVVMGTDCIGS